MSIMVHHITNGFALPTVAVYWIPWYVKVMCLVNYNVNRARTINETMIIYGYTWSICDKIRLKNVSNKHPHSITKKIIIQYLQPYKFIFCQTSHIHAMRSIINNHKCFFFISFDLETNIIIPRIWKLLNTMHSNRLTTVARLYRWITKKSKTEKTYYYTGTYTIDKNIFKKR